MGTDENKAIVRRLYDEGFNRGDGDLLDELLSPGFVDHTASSDQAPGAAGIKQAWQWFHEVFPDIHLIVEEVIAEGGTVAARVTMQGTHCGAFMGLPPTGKAVMVTGLEICHIAEGKIVDLWSEFGLLDAMRQLGGSAQ